MGSELHTTISDATDVDARIRAAGAIFGSLRKALFASKGSNLYRPKAVDDGEMYGGGAGNDEEGLLATAKFKPDKGFSGAEGRGGGGGSAGPRTGPVEFEADADDPFGLNDFMTEVNTGKRAMENIGSRGTMHANG